MADGYSALPADEVELLKRGAINKHGKPVDLDDQVGLKNSEAGEELEINVAKPVAPKRKSRIHMKLEPEIFEIDLGEDGPLTTTSIAGNDQSLSNSVPLSDKKGFNDEIRSVQKTNADSIDCKSMNLGNASAAASATSAHTLRDNATT
ncbi:hypothetical protein T4A_10169 [Trichinella pseudospiralis]|uniref:Uncharacterized protein n=1 Tax=Trichinella pseudospiralis TaxID=6337 RepID=A0A0V1EJH5_TRIPS|nr:hypothetical protein T4A_10169 [Trichinella pseudospiralis]